MAPSQRLHTLIKRLATEPFVHFLALGLLIFAWHGFRDESPASGPAPADRRIVITQENIGRLIAQWQRNWDRSPTREEIDGLVQDYLKEEIYYREALRLGLDKDDLVIRRRLRSKMEFLASAEIENKAPDEKTLRAWCQQNQSRYLAGKTYSFDQVYLGDDRGPTIGQPQIKKVLDQLKAGADPAHLGVSAPLPASYTDMSESDVVHSLGREIITTLDATEAGNWTGPVRSAFGLHLIRLRAMTPARMLPFEEVRKRVENDWRADTLSQREAAGYAELVKSYDISIEGQK